MSRTWLAPEWSNLVRPLRLCPFLILHLTLLSPSSWCQADQLRQRNASLEQDCRARNADSEAQVLRLRAEVGKS